MAVRAICVALVLSSLPAAGCGTVANLTRQQPGAGGVSPFGGVKQDVSCIHQAANGELVSRTHPKSGSEHYPQTALMLFCAADLPFSLVGDLVTWPYTVAYSFINQPIPIPPVTEVTPLPPVTQPMPMPVPPEAQATAGPRPQTSPSPPPRKVAAE